MHATPLVGRIEHSAGCGPEPLVIVGHDELHAAQAAIGKGARGKPVQNVPASEGPVAMQSTSRHPSSLTATAMITARLMIRPFSLTRMLVASSQR